MKLLRYSLLFTVLAFTALSVNAGVEWKALDVGNLSSAIFNTAVVGYPSNPTQNPSGWWPAGTNDSYIYEGDIWIGAKKNGEVGVAEADGRQSEIWPIPIEDPDTGALVDILSKKPGVTTRGTPTNQAIRFKCSDTNEEVNKGVILGLEIEVNGFQWSYAPSTTSLSLSITSKTLEKTHLKMCLWRFGTMWTFPVMKLVLQVTQRMTLSL